MNAFGVTFDCEGGIFGSPEARVKQCGVAGVTAVSLLVRAPGFGDVVIGGKQQIDRIFGGLDQFKVWLDQFSEIVPSAPAWRKRKPAARHCECGAQLFGIAANFNGSCADCRGDDDRMYGICGACEQTTAHARVSATLDERIEIGQLVRAARAKPELKHPWEAWSTAVWES